MKKIIAIFLIPVFLLMTAGVAITTLYCKGKISSIGINVKACCKDVNKGGCCNTKSKIVKVEDTFVSSQPSFEFSKLIFLFVPAFQIIFDSDLLDKSDFKSYWGKAPPFIQSELYIVFHSLII